MQITHTHSTLTTLTTHTTHTSPRAIYRGVSERVGAKGRHYNKDSYFVAWCCWALGEPWQWYWFAVIIVSFLPRTEGVSERVQKLLVPTVASHSANQAASQPAIDPLGGRQPSALLGAAKLQNLNLRCARYAKLKLLFAEATVGGGIRVLGTHGRTSGKIENFAGIAAIPFAEWPKGMTIQRGHDSSSGISEQRRLLVEYFCTAVRIFRPPQFLSVSFLWLLLTFSSGKQMQFAFW